jgi:hypothetical protein
MDALERLADYGANLITNLQDAIKSKPVSPYGPVNASGRLAASLRVEVSATATGYQLLLYGASYALALEYGRKPGKFPNLTAIRQWIDTRGIVPYPDAKGSAVSKDSLAFLIARKIAQNGTTIYQQGQPTGLFGQFIGPDIAAKELARVLLPVFTDEVRSALRLAA